MPLEMKRRKLLDSKENIRMKITHSRNEMRLQNTVARSHNLKTENLHRRKIL